MRRLVDRRVQAAVLTAVLAVVLVPTAAAFWRGSGTGTATAVLASPSPPQLTLGPGAAGADVAPGHAGGVAVVATNTSPSGVAIASLQIDADAGRGGFDVDADHSGCDPSVLHLAAQDNGGAGWQVPPRVGSTDGTQTIDLGGALTMDADAAAACQGATFVVHLVTGS